MNAASINFIRILKRNSNKAYSLADSGLNSLFRLSCGIMIAQLGGPEAFAQYILLNTLYFIVLGLVAAACDTPMLNLAPGQEAPLRKTFISWSAQRSRRFALLVFAIGLLAIPLTRALGLDTVTYFGFLVATLSGISAQFNRAALQASFRMKRALLADCITPIVVLATTLLSAGLLNTPNIGFWWGSAVGLAISSALMKQRDGKVKNPTPHADLQTRAKTSGRSILIGSIANTANSRALPYLLGIIGGSAQIASFGAAWTLLGPLRLTVMALANLLRPHLASLYGRKDENGFKRALRTAYLLVAFCGFTLALALFIFGEPLVALLFGNGLEVSSGLLVFAVAYATLDATTSLQMIHLQIRFTEGPAYTAKLRIQAAILSLSVLIPCILAFNTYGAFAALIAAESFYAIRALHRIRSETSKTAPVDRISHPSSDLACRITDAPSTIVNA